MMAYQKFKEASYSLTYARQKINCIVKALAMQRSIRVAGLSGMGKSNLLRFLVSHPQLLQNQLDIMTDTIYYIYIDCNKLNPVSGLSFYRECNFVLQAKQDLSLLIADEYILYKQLALTLQQLTLETFIILVIDRAEVLYNAVGETFFSQLRNLRDEARAGRMAFIFGSQRPIGDLYELEKLFSRTCWIGPFSDADRGDFFARHEKRLKIPINESWREAFWQLSGAHPGFLKNCLNWFNLHLTRNPFEDEAQLIQDLLNYEPIKKYCWRLWAGLKQSEQTAIMNFIRQPNRSILHQTSEIQILQQMGLIWTDFSEIRIFSPLWEAYLQHNIVQKLSSDLQIKMDVATRRMILHWRGKNVSAVITRTLLFDLAQIMSSTPGKLYTKDALIDAVYGEPVSDDALFQLIKDLRKLLKRLVKQLCPEMSQSLIQNVRGVGYQLIAELPDDIC